MNTIKVLAAISYALPMSLVQVVWRPVAAEPSCSDSPDGTQRSPAEGAVCGVDGLGAWIAELPGRIWQAAVTGWPWLFAAVAVALLVVFAGWAVHRAAWRRAVAGGYWVRVIPPRQVDPGRAEDGWRLLAGLARMARQGWWRPARPPLAFEVYQGSGKLTAGLWLPGRVPYPAATAEAARVWPGARLDRTEPPTLTGHQDGSGRWRVAGVRLRAARSETGFLVDDTRHTGIPARGASGGDCLQAVLDALGKPDGPALLQVLVRPAPSGRLVALDRASRYPATPGKKASHVVVDAVTAVLLGALRFVLGLFMELIGPTRSQHSRGTGHGGDRLRRPDPVQARAMRDAAEKLAGGPHVIATIRVGVSRRELGFARAAASTIGYGFRTVARHLFPARMRRASLLFDERRARSREWLLLSTAELAVLAHLPADPARHGFDTTALHRRWPGGASRADPEQPTTHTAGWTRDGWTSITEPDAIDSGPGELGAGDNHRHDTDQPPMEAP